jgi:hypothetical protein
VALGIFGAALSGVASFGAEEPLYAAVGVLAALVAIIVLVMQHGANRVLRFDIRSADWRQEGPDYVYVISRKRARGRRSPQVFARLSAGGEEEVIADVHVTEAGDVRIGSGSRDRLTVYLQ